MLARGLAVLLNLPQAYSFFHFEKIAYVHNPDDGKMLYRFSAFVAFPPEIPLLKLCLGVAWACLGVLVMPPLQRERKGTCKFDGQFVATQAAVEKFGAASFLKRSNGSNSPRSHYHNHSSDMISRSISLMQLSGYTSCCISGAQLSQL